MKVSLNQKQIETAILMFLNASGMAALPGKTTFDFTATRKKKDGEEGEVLCDIEVADPQITFTSQTPEVDVNVKDDMPGADIDVDDPASPEELMNASEQKEESSEEQQEETSEQTEEAASAPTENRPFANLKSAEEQEEESNESNEHNTDQASGNAASLFKR